MFIKSSYASIGVQRYDFGSFCTNSFRTASSIRAPGWWSDFISYRASVTPTVRQSTRTLNEIFYISDIITVKIGI